MKMIANRMHFQQLNQQIRSSPDTWITVEQCIGQRYIGAGLTDKTLRISGVPGNGLGAYLNGATLITEGNVQDATGDTMNDGKIFIHGNCGDCAGYGMRGGGIYVHGDVGYRAGIHMKAYQGKLPVLVIGGCAGSFLGEYQAGGIIVVLGLHKAPDTPLLGYFCGTGMHGGKIFLRCDRPPTQFPEQIVVSKASPQERARIDVLLTEFCEAFHEDKAEIFSESFYVLTPNSKNPYKQLYTYH